MLLLLLVLVIVLVLLYVYTKIIFSDSHYIVNTIFGGLGCPIKTPQAYFMVDLGVRLVHPRPTIYPCCGPGPAGYLTVDPSADLWPREPWSPSLLVRNTAKIYI